MSQTWTQCLNTLKNTIPLTEFSMWVQPIKAVEKPNSLSLITPNKSAFDYIKKNLKKPIKSALSQHNKNLKIYIGTAHQKSPTTNYTASLTPEYTFENLVLGDANQMAYGAAQQIAQNIKKSPYNPFIIYGNSGLGKTHLMQAAGHLALATNPNTKIIYVPLMDFVRNITTSLRHNTIEQVKLLYQSADLLLVDDIHLIAGKEKSQEEFFHIFNFLFNTKKQIIFTCDQPPKSIKDLENRLKTRFSQGLNLHLSPPEIEMRAAILLKKAHNPIINIKLNEDNALFIAQHITSNVRDLEGALLRLKAYIDFLKINQNSISKEIIEAALSDLIKPLTKNININDIQKETAKHHNLTVSDLISKHRKSNIVLARQMAIAIANELTTLSLTKIGEHFGGKDHTTVIHSIKKIEQKIKNDEEVKESYDLIKLKLANL